MLNEKLYRRVLHWDDMPLEDVRPGVRRRSYATDQVQLVMNICDVGMAANPHKHDDFDQLAMIVSGRANYWIDNVPYEMGPGSFLLVPAGSMHRIEPLEAGVLNLDVFAPPRHDLLHLVGYLDDVASIGR